MKSFCRIVVVGWGLLGMVTEANAQSEAILRLRASLGDLTRRPDFSHDPAYVDTLDRLAYEEQKETLEQQAVQLLLNNRQKDKLFSIVSHDLRGPLNSLKTLMDCLKEKKLSEEELREVMNEFRRNVDYSSELVSNLLFWAGSQLEGMVTRPMLLPVRPMVQDILELYSYQACQKNVWLNEELEPSLHAFADRDMVQVILRNLISNAIKFCRLGDSVTVISRRVDQTVEICVADTGIGLKAEALDKIRRKESFTSYGTAKEKGTGLGILLCHEFAEANGGRFWLESEWGKGCHCYFSLPIGPVALQEQDNILQGY